MPKNSVPQLRLAVRKAASDGRVTDRETRGLIGTAAKNTLTRQERATLKDALATRRDDFDGIAAIRMSRLLRATGGKARAADPAVMIKDRGALDYSKARGALVTKGFRAGDIAQGQAGDCYLLASLGAIAKKRPGAIRDAIVQRADGSFAVRFHERTPEGVTRPVYVKVDRDLPRDRHGRLHYARNSSARELWVSVIEKAFAQWKGGYEQIGNGGSVASAMEALTGRAATTSQTRSGPAADVFASLRSHLAKKGFAVASTGDDKSRYTNTGLAPNHAYTITGVSTSGGRQYVHLRNPWGHFEPGDARGDGSFKLTLERFVKHYDHVTLG